MALELSLTDGTTTIDLLDGTYIVEQYVPQAPESSTATRPQPGIDGDGVYGVAYRDVYESMRLVIQAASKSALQTAVQDLETLLATARRRTNVRAGDAVYLQLQVDGDSDTYRSEVLDARLVLDVDSLITWTGSTVTGELIILRRYYWEGPSETLYFDGAAATATIRNTDGTSPYNVATFDDVAGTIPAPFVLTLTNATGSAVDFTDVYVATDAHIGFTGTQHLIAPGTATVNWTDSSAHNVIRYDLAITDAAVAACDGHSCHIIAAFSDSAVNTYLRASLRYKSGGVYNELMAAREVFTGAGAKEVIDFGPVQIPPLGAPATTGLTVVITAYSSTTEALTLDYISLFPAHHFKRLYQTGFNTANGAAIVDDGILNEAYVKSGSTKYPIVRSSQNQLMVWPGRTNRLYVQCAEGAGHNTSIVLTASATYRPRRLTV